MTQPPHAEPSVAVSVVIASARSDLLADQLRALAAQRFDRSWEVVVVTAEPTPPAGLGDLALRTVLVDRPLPPGPARNIGVAEARGDLLAFCDDDDQVAPGWLAAIVGGLQGHDAVGGAEDVTRLNAPEVITAYGRDSIARDQLPTVSRWRSFIETANLGIRRDVFASVGGFDERFEASEDRDLSLRLHAAGFRLGFAPAAVVHRRLRVGIRPQASQAFAWGRSEALLYRCHRHEGLPAAGPDGGWRGWARLLRDLPHLADRTRRGAWIRRGAHGVGRLAGSVQYRTWYL